MPFTCLRGRLLLEGVEERLVNSLCSVRGSPWRRARRDALTQTSLLEIASEAIDRALGALTLAPGAYQSAKALPSVQSCLIIPFLANCEGPVVEGLRPASGPTVHIRRGSGCHGSREHVRGPGRGRAAAHFHESALS